MKLTITPILVVTCTIIAGCSGNSEKNAESTSDGALHLLQPDYPMAYGVPDATEVKAKMDTILNYLIEVTPTRIIDPETKEELTCLDSLAPKHTFDGKYRLSSYEWGVTYSAMLAAADLTGDKDYRNYAIDRMNYMAHLYPYLQNVYEREGKLHSTMIKMVSPKALDDGGAICSAMMKASINDSTLNYRDMTENYFDYIENREHRLDDGTFARNRPHHNTLWLDDMFMGIPSLAVRGKYANSPEYFDKAANQVCNFADRMWVPEKRLFRHGWVESMPDHPAFFWGRANGWALLTLCEVLDYLPEDHPKRPYITSLLQNHVSGLTELQGNDGLWHQLLDRPDTYGETSATALFVYGIAHAINKGWIDAKTYGPAALLGWNALAEHIQPTGEITGTCVGTGMGFDPTFYAHRPVSTAAAHIYGPTIWAGAEIITLLNTQHAQMNDSAVQFYDTDPETDYPIFELTEDNKGKLVQ